MSLSHQNSFVAFFCQNIMLRNILCLYCITRTIKCSSKEIELNLYSLMYIRSLVVLSSTRHIRTLHAFMYSSLCLQNRLGDVSIFGCTVVNQRLLVQLKQIVILVAFVYRIAYVTTYMHID